MCVHAPIIWEEQKSIFESNEFLILCFDFPSSAAKQCAIWSTHILFQHFANPTTYLGNSSSLANSWDNCLLINMVTGAWLCEGLSLIESLNRKIPRRCMQSFDSESQRIAMLLNVIIKSQSLIRTVIDYSLFGIVKGENRNNYVCFLVAST